MATDPVTPKISPGLPLDYQKGWVKGWGVLRSEPWCLYAVCVSREEALALKKEAGVGFHVRYGSHLLGSDDFITSSTRTRWVKSPLEASDLNDQRIFAQMVTTEGGQYEGVGEIRARKHPNEPLVAIDLSFTRTDSPVQLTNIVYHLNKSQAARIEKSTSDKFEFRYDGILQPEESFSIELDVEEKLHAVDELQLKTELLRPFSADVTKSIEKKLYLDWTYNSTALEGSKISRGETEVFLELGLTAKGKPFKDYLDIRGHDTAIHFLIDIVRRKEPLTEAVIRELHKILLVESYELPAETLDGKPSRKKVQLGEYKSLPNHVKTSTGEVHHFALPADTPAQMEALMRWYRNQLGRLTIHPVVFAAVFHHRFTAIHPFDDGNGRMARLLMNLILIQHNLPPAVMRVENRDHYLFSLRMADAGEYSDMIESVAHEVLRSQEIVYRVATGQTVTESDDIDKEIKLLKQEFQHLSGAAVWDLEVQKNLFKTTVMPLIRRIVEKLSQFDDFFAATEVSVDGLAENQNVSFKEVHKANLLKEIATFANNSGLFSQLHLLFHWRELKKSPLNEFVQRAYIIFEFKRLQYKVSVPDGKVALTKAYTATLTETEIINIIEALCRPVITAIKNAQSK